MAIAKLSGLASLQYVAGRGEDFGLHQFEIHVMKFLVYIWTGFKNAVCREFQNNSQNIHP